MFCLSYSDMQNALAQVPRDCRPSLSEEAWQHTVARASERLADPSSHMSYKAPRRADGGDLGGRSVVVIPNEDASDVIDPIIIACFSSTQLYQDPVIAKGEGRSRIRLGIDMRTGARYALVIRKDGPTATSFESSITVLKKCAGPGVVKLVGSLTYSRVTKDGEQKKRMLVLPYYSGGRLMTAL
ncbi:MAG: hypothetical protein KGQ49_07060, partial [Verrucomicrobia bacterium]|nr:hypothetical protein [Verrucomicrobiota bacterium]